MSSKSLSQASKRGKKIKKDQKFKTTMTKERLFNLFEQNKDKLRLIPKRRTLINIKKANLNKNQIFDDEVDIRKKILFENDQIFPKVEEDNEPDSGIENPKFKKIFSKIENYVRKQKRSLEMNEFNIQENLPFKKVIKRSTHKKNTTQDVRNHYNFETLVHEKNLNFVSFSHNDLRHQNTLSNNEKSENLPVKSEDIKNSSDIYNGENSCETLKLNKKNYTSNRKNLTPTEDSFREMKVAKNVYDSCSEEEIEDLYLRDEFVLLVKINGNFKHLWEIIIILLTFYVLIFVPLIITENFESDSLIMKFQHFCDFIFICDIATKFLSQYSDKEDNKISNLKLIFFNYVVGKFFFDVLVSVPFCFINDKSYDILSSFLKWIKLLRVFNLFTYEKLVELKINSNSKLNKVFKMIILFFILVHISSCLFIFTAMNSLNLEKSNWIIQYRFDEISNFELYITSYYYNLVSIYTIGYGDILPANTIERIYTISLLLIGTMLYSFGVSSLSILFGKDDTKELILRNKLKLLDEITEENHLSQSILKTIKQNIYYEFNKYDNDKYNLLDSLPNNLKNELTVIMYRSLIKELDFFKNQSHDFILFVLPFLKSHINNKGEVLYSVGEYIEEMYLVVKGCLGINLGAFYDNLEIGEISENRHFGELFMQINKQSTYELKCKSNNSELLVLKKNDFMLMKKSFPDNTMKMLKQSFKTLEIIDRRRQQFEKLYKFAHSAKEVKKLMNELNFFLLQKDFDNYFLHDKELQEAYDFIVRNSFKKITNIIFQVDSARTRNNYEETKNRPSLGSNCKKQEKTFQQKISDRIEFPTWRKFSHNEDIIKKAYPLKNSSKSIEMQNKMLSNLSEEKRRNSKHFPIFQSNKSNRKESLSKKFELSSVNSKSSSILDETQTPAPFLKNKPRNSVSNYFVSNKKKRSNLERRKMRYSLIRDYQNKIMSTEKFDEFIKEENELNEKTISLLNFGKINSINKVNLKTHNYSSISSNKMNSMNDISFDRTENSTNFDQTRSNFNNSAMNKSKIELKNYIQSIKKKTIEEYLAKIKGTNKLCIENTISFQINCEEKHFNNFFGKKKTSFIIHDKKFSLSQIKSGDLIRDLSIDITKEKEMKILCQLDSILHYLKQNVNTTKD